MAGVPKAVYNSLISKMKHNATKRGKPWVISNTDVIDLMNSDCAFCKKPPSNRYCYENRYTLIYSGIDRIDSREGYTYQNTVPCCRVCNMVKQDMGIEVLWPHLLNMVLTMSELFMNSQTKKLVRLFKRYLD